MTDMSTKRSYYNQPTDLSRKGKEAYRVIMRVLSENHGVDSGGSKVFYSPSEWKERGEQYGTESVLIITYDGGDHRRFFNMDEDYSCDCMKYELTGKPPKEPYANTEKMRKALAEVGLFVEECTCWFAAVYTM